MKKMAMLGVVAASLGLSACGVTASLHQSIDSIGSSPYLQVHLSATASGPDVAQASTLLAETTVDVRYAATGGGPLSQAGSAVDSEVLVNVGAATVADVREIGSNFYVQLDPSSLANVPGLGISASELSAAQFLVAGRWFEVPQSLIASSVPASSATPAQISQAQSDARTLIDALTSALEAANSSTLSGGGYRVTGTIQSLDAALAPTIDSLTHQSWHEGTVGGDYTVELHTSGGTATGASIDVTGPGATGTDEITLDATISHDTDAIAVPTGVTILTPAIISSLENQAS